MAELFLSAVLPVLFEKLTSPELLNFATQEGVRSKLKKWEKTLKMINALLVDAEEKQLTDGAVKMWLEELQDLAYDAEDILDEYATEALRRNLKIAEHQASTSTARKLIPACCIGFTPTALWSDFSMISQIDEITSRLDELCKQRAELGLQTTGGGRSQVSSQRPPTSSLPTEAVVYGRDDDKAKILEMVLSDEAACDGANFAVIPIVGMGGIGKTTLAQAVYNDKAVEDYNPKVWVCVSDDFDVLRISKRILESITLSRCEMEELSAIQNQLKHKINGKKFLIVLDDVWCQDYYSWETLKSPFMAGARGSKIIVTTRLQPVALILSPSKWYELTILSDDDCWLLFQKHAVFVGRTRPIQNSEVIRKEVVQKCKGLPLAARTLGGILRSKATESEWMDVLQSKIWELPGGCDILPVLRLSYYHLPSNLKRCFAYCAIFPKDYEFEEKELVLLWMAEGLIESSRDNEQLEKIGSEYFRELVSRSIIQISGNNHSKFIMHDLVNDLALIVSGKLSFRLEDEIKTDNQLNIFEKTRYASYICHSFNGKSKFEIFNFAKLLRMLLPIPPANDKLTYRYVSKTVVSDLLRRFIKLRVLSLQGHQIVELPNSIGNLRLLRFLNLSDSRLRSLPESINSICNLQTLKLRNCDRLLRLPYSMDNLIKLRHFDIFGSSLIEAMPMGVTNWKFLRTLSNFIVGKDSGSVLEDLKHLKYLSGELHISRLENVNDFRGTKKYILADKQNLEVLSLEWESDIQNVRDEEVEKKVLDMLQPHKNLKELQIKGYCGMQFSSWVGDYSFAEITVIKLEDCRKCISLPSLGLLGSLKSLTIIGMEGLRSIGSEFYGEGCLNSFRSLEILYFGNLKEWEHWEDVNENEGVESFSKLRELSIVHCPKLMERLPKNLFLLEELVIRHCEQLVVSLSEIPSLCKLQIDKCKRIVSSSPSGSKSLNSLSLSHISEIGNWLTQEDFQRVSVLEVKCCDELIKLWQNKSFLEQPPQGLHSLISLKEISLRNCKTLTTSLEGIKHYMSYLEKLEVNSCSSLTCIFRGQLPPSLKSIQIVSCEELQCVLVDNEDCSSTLHRKNINSSTSYLGEQYIGEGPSLTCLTLIKQSYVVLTTLDIWNCSKLTDLSSTGHLLMTLKILVIRNCSELTTLFPSGQLPEMLETLNIGCCPKLESIVEKFHINKALKEIVILSCSNLKFIPKGLHTVTSLRDFFIHNCGSLVFFPDGGFPNSVCSVYIHGCEMLKALPSKIHTCTSLQHLTLRGCQSVSFPEGGFPTNLIKLEIEGFKLYEPLFKWGFENLTSLKTLDIRGVSLPIQEEEMVLTLPLTLTYLGIRNSPNLKNLSSNCLQELNSLEELRFWHCPNLTSLPILPPSLLRLLIYNCPLLKMECKRDEGKEWSKIADIPNVHIDGKFIYNP